MSHISELPVTKLMKKKFVKLKPNDSIKKVFKLFSEKRVNSIPVFEGKKFIGEVHKLDLLKLVVNPRKMPFEQVIKFGVKADFGYYAKKVSDILTRHETTINADATVGEAAMMMLVEGDSLIPVVKDGKIIGVITEQDIVNAIFRRMKK
ncbi:MAG: CBS domain-containing protein [Candidatus Diapherotrites archaeon]|nr:CBS domain-containing protein [Candidatus Diapherotrites archaeon]